MKKFKFFALLIFLASSLFAKTHVGTFQFMDLRNGNPNSFDTTIEVKYEIKTLMGEPVVKAEAKYSIMGLVNIDGENYDLSKEKLDKLKIYKLKIKVPFESNSVHRLLWIEIDMGAMGKQNEWSYNTPGSPNWSKWIIGEGGYLSKKDAIKAYKGFERLGMVSGLGSLAEVVSINHDVSMSKEKKKVLKDVWVDEETGLMWQDEKYTKREINNYEKYYKKGKNIGKTGSWYHANKYCQDLTLSGYFDWRLANINELNKVKDKRRKFQYNYFGSTWASNGKDKRKYYLSFQSYKKGKKYIWLDKKDVIWTIRCVRSVK